MALYQRMKRFGLMHQVLLPTSPRAKEAGVDPCKLVNPVSKISECRDRPFESCSATTFVDSFVLLCCPDIYSCRFLSR